MPLLSHQHRPRPVTIVRALVLGAAALIGAAGAAHLRAAFAGGVAARIAIPPDFAPAPALPAPRGAYRTIPIYQLDIDAAPYAPTSEMAAVLVGKGDVPAPAALLLSVKGGQLSPAVCVVAKGTKLSIRNESSYEHHPYADAAEFDGGVLAKDKTSAEVALSKPGVVLVKDRLWPHVEAKIVVVEDAFVLPVTATTPVADLEFPGVAAGPHELRVYFRGEIHNRAAVDVPGGAAVAKVAVTLAPWVPPPPASAPASAPDAPPAPGSGDGEDDGAPKGKGDETGADKASEGKGDTDEDADTGKGAGEDKGEDAKSAGKAGEGKGDKGKGGGKAGEDKGKGDKGKGDAPAGGGG